MSATPTCWWRFARDAVRNWVLLARRTSTRASRLLSISGAAQEGTAASARRTARASSTTITTGGAIRRRSFRSREHALNEIPQVSINDPHVWSEQERERIADYLETVARQIR